MKRRSIAAFALAAALTATAFVEPAMAYFTDSTQAQGGYTVILGGTDIQEDFFDWTKHITITCSEGAQAYYVRARAFAGKTYDLTYNGDDGWRLGADGWYYYDPILYGGEQTTELRVRIENVPADAEPGDHFNVQVVYECTPVLYGADGTPYADWKKGGANWA